MKHENKKWKWKPWKELKWNMRHEKWKWKPWIEKMKNESEYLG